MSDPFLGEIRMVGFNYAPYGWALCQGQTMSVSQNTALFTLLGTSFGGNGQTTFQLPDLRSRTPVGMGQGLGLSDIVLGEQDGVESVQLTTANMPQHTHVASVSSGGAVTGSIAVPATTATGSQSGSPSNTSVLGPVSAANHAGDLYSTAAANTTLAPFNVSLQGAAPAVENSMTGGNLPFSLRNPYLGINFIIAMQGIFPSRG
jgi:microcystin-dependent protein